MITVIEDNILMVPDYTEIAACGLPMLTDVKMMEERSSHMQDHQLTGRVSERGIALGRARSKYGDKPMDP